MASSAAVEMLSALRGPPRGQPRGEPLVIQIASKDKGRLIGTKGASIRDLETRSGARIVIGESNEERRGPSSTNIHLYGSEEQQKKASEMIDQHLGYGKSATDVVVDDGPIDWAALKESSERERREKWAKCPDLIKNFYEEHPEVAEMSAEDVAKFRKDNNSIEISNFDENSTAPLLNPCPRFRHAFQRFPDIMATIEKQGFEKPSPIQTQAWPYLLSGKDLIGIAQTGTGKTLAFLLPAFIHIEGQATPRGQRGGPNVLVLSPTRELALQIADEVKKYEYRGIKSVCVYGGGSRREQMKIVTEGVEIVIATPGRLNDLVEAGVIVVESVTYLVLDEADRMLDMGFEPQIRKVLMDIRPDRQTVMTSATWPSAVRRLATQYMNDPVTVFIGTLELAAVHSVTQQIRMVEDEKCKFDILVEFLDSMEKDDKVIVFVGKKARVDDVASDLCLKGYIVQSIHGDREQSDREQALADLRSGEVKILIATDVASRGIDIQDITYVFNYDFPRNIEEYVHRVGRTGRAGKTGKAMSLMEKRGGDWKSAQELIDILSEAHQEVPQELVDMAARYARVKERQAEERAQMPGFGSGGRGNGCFKCGETGHSSRECPNDDFGGGGFGGGGGGRGGGRGGGCFKCGQEGHISRECPNGGSSGGRGGRGGGGAGGRGGGGCFKCGQSGHISRNCTESSAWK